MQNEELSFWQKLRRWLVRFFLSGNQCNEHCSDCITCPWIDKEKYSFDIKRKAEYKNS
jgi:hypothetical protein